VKIGIDLGGTKIEGILLDAAGDEVLRQRVPTPRGDYTATVDAICGLVERLEAAGSTRATVGIGHPGAISPATGVLKNANSTWLNGRPLDRDLSHQLSRPVWLANDANCFALSEATDGAAAGFPVVFGVIVGTGTGAGIVVNGHPVTGANAIAGEWGHNPLPWPRQDEWPGPPCYCGRSGCIETFLSGPGLAHDFARAAGVTLTAVQVVERANQGDAEAASCLERYVERMARALASVINVLDPSVIVLGGGMSNLSILYERVPALWTPFVFSDRVDTILTGPRHGDSSGVRGAAWLPERAATGMVRVAEP
jgi:fructokinase